MNITVIEDKSLSKLCEPRYIVIDAETGEILDDAQGYGFKSIKGAYASYYYKNSDSYTKKQDTKNKEKKIKQWMKEHQDFIDEMDDIAFEIAKGSWGPNTKFNSAFVKGLLSEHYLELSDFTPGDLLKVWKNS